MTEPLKPPGEGCTPDARSAPQPELRLQSTIDAAEVERLGVGLERALYDLALAGRARRMNMSPVKVNAIKKRCRLGMWLCLVGLAATLGILALGGTHLGGYPIVKMFGLYFGSMLVLVMVAPPFLAWAVKPWQRYWKRLAHRNAVFLLRTARANAPFEAQYEFWGDTAAYSRIADGRPQAAWQRRLVGLRFSGTGFTLLYKNAKSIAPYALLLHQPSDSFDALLDKLGVYPFPLSQ
jgi:hypothetical protein